MNLKRHLMIHVPAPVVLAAAAAVAAGAGTPTAVAASPAHVTAAAGVCSGAGAGSPAQAVQQDWNTLKAGHKYKNEQQLITSLTNEVACYPKSERAGLAAQVKQLAAYLHKHPKYTVTTAFLATGNNVAGDTWTATTEAGRALVSLDNLPTYCQEVSVKGTVVSINCGLEQSSAAPQAFIDMTLQDPATHKWYVSSRVPGSLAPTSAPAPAATDAATCTTTGAPTPQQAVEEDFNTLLAGAEHNYGATLVSEVPCVNPEQQFIQDLRIASVYQLLGDNPGVDLAVGFSADGPIADGSVWTSPTEPTSAIVSLTGNAIENMAGTTSTGQLLGTATERYTAWWEADNGAGTPFAPLDRVSQDITGGWEVNALPPGLSEMPQSSGAAAKAGVAFGKVALPGAARAVSAGNVRTALAHELHIG